MCHANGPMYSVSSLVIEPGLTQAKSLTGILSKPPPPPPQNPDLASITLHRPITFKWSFMALKDLVTSWVTLGTSHNLQGLIFIMYKSGSQIVPFINFHLASKFFYILYFFKWEAKIKMMIFARIFQENTASIFFFTEDFFSLFFLFKIPVERPWH